MTARNKAKTWLNIIISIVVFVLFIYMVRIVIGLMSDATTNKTIGLFIAGGIIFFLVIFGLFKTKSLLKKIR